MNSEREALPSRALLSRCAERWGLRNIAFVRKMENIVFVCDSDAGTVYLRLTTPLRRARPEIEAEIHWIEHLSICGLQVPRIIADREGHTIGSFIEGQQHFEAVVFSAVVGDHPSEEIATDSTFLKTLGALIATMHQASQRYKEHHLGIKREEWFEERGLRCALIAAAVSTQSTLRSKLEEKIAWMRQLPRTPDVYGLVHADLGALNLFIGEDRSIRIIDFDDSCYHWFVFDLAIVIFSMIGRFGYVTPQPEEARWLTDLIEGYQTVRSLRKREIALIAQFMDFAYLRLFFWIEYHESLGTFPEAALERVAKVKQLCVHRVRDC